mgnify:CR=1 FL=1
MTSDETICIDETNDEKINNVIKDGVRNYNAPYFGSNRLKSFTIYIKNIESNIIAGLIGSYREKRYLHIDLLWVEETLRDRGLGKKLILKCEEFSKINGCSYIQLDTFDFQARPFYEKLGFECVGTIPQWTEGRDCYFMKKTLT